jgi:hypothetical protein
MDYNEIISQLRNIDLSRYPKDIILSLLAKLSKFPIVEIPLNPGKLLIRARPNNINETFTTRNQLSYAPLRCNKKYMRASIPEHTMLYACPFPNKKEVNDLKEPAITACLEVSNLLRNDLDGEEKITFSKWEVKKEISLYAACFNSEFIEQSDSINALNNYYKNKLKDFSEEETKFFLTINEFIADEFAKEIKPNDPDFLYMISAIFTQMVINNGKGGVYYPSVKTKSGSGVGFNIAISPETTDSSLKLIMAVEGTLYKIGKQIFVDWNTIAEIHDDTKEFNYKPVNESDHFGKQKVLEILHIKKQEKELQLD